MKKILIKCIVFCILTTSLYCQNKTIRGRIINEDIEVIPMVSILNNGNVEVGKTDMNGNFQIEIPATENKLLFKFIGFEPLSIELIDRCDVVEGVMMLSGNYDFMTLKKVDRLRKRRFKKLQELHKVAFEKGFFKTERTCYTQDFVPYCEKKR